VFAVYVLEWLGPVGEPTSVDFRAGSKVAINQKWGSSEKMTFPMVDVQMLAVRNYVGSEKSILMRIVTKHTKLDVEFDLSGLGDAINKQAENCAQ
jgi:hypothetical protein